MAMTTGAKVMANVPSEFHTNLVSKARALGVSDPKPRPYHELQDEVNAVFVASGLAQAVFKHKLGPLDLLEQLNLV